MALLLPWFPILLGVGVGGRLLGRARGYGLGLLGALFWIALIQGTAGPLIWSVGGGWTAATIIAGAVAVLFMGGWAGEAGMPASLGSGSRKAGASDLGEGGGFPPSPPSDRSDTSSETVISVLDQFEDWLEDHRNDADPWPKFDELIRTVMYRCCQATRVRPYRLAGEGGELIPLREPESLWEGLGSVQQQPVSARRGILGHVITTGRSYYADDPNRGELVAKLAAEPGEPDHTTELIAWCFPIRQGKQRIGVVAASRLEIPSDGNKQLLRAVERLVNRMWCTLCEVCQGRAAVQIDSVSGLCTREAFLRTAERSLEESYRLGEPVALGVIALERLRALNDSGRWEVADELVREVSNALRRKVRLDDRLGRFDGSRMLLLLRRVDSELATLIVSQVMSRLKTICEDQSRWRASIGVRCGVVGSGAEKPELRALISSALSQCHRARVEGVPIASDLDRAEAAAPGHTLGEHNP